MSGSLRPPAGFGNVGSPFHAGEQAVQTRLGVRERIEQTGRRIVRDFMPDQHREFFEDLPFLLVGSQSAEGEVWASLLVGEPGFVRAPTARRLEVRARPLPADPLRSQLVLGEPLGMLGIELSTRRRNRVNGRVVAADDNGFALGVEQSFGNCKQYIQSRAGNFRAVSEVEPPQREGAQLSAAALAVLERTDTTFIATSSQEPKRGGPEGVDVSHRGGLPGFIRADVVDGATRLVLPDYFGNFLFNSFGNLEVNPRAGLLAIDFDSGEVLSVTGSARVIWEGPEIAAVPSAERLLEYRVQAGLRWKALADGWSTVEISPHLREMAPPSR
jgi:uncharacterized protein